MVVCKYFAQGCCRYGTNCRFEHAFPSKYSYSGNQARNVVPQAASSNFILRAPSFRGAGEGPQQSVFTTKNRYEPLSNPNQQPRGPNAGDTAQMVSQEMLLWEASGQWPLSCFAPNREQDCIPGFEDVSPEELRKEAYEARQTGNMDAYARRYADLLTGAQQQRNVFKQPSSKVREILNKLSTGEYSRKNIQPADTSSFSFSSAFSEIAPGNVFGGSSVNQGGVFGGLAGNQSSVPFGTSTANQNSIFGAGAAATSNIFGGSAAQQSPPFGLPATNQNSVFGGPSTLQASSAGQTSIFGDTLNNQASVFGGTAASQVFGGTGAVANQVFSSSAAKQPSPFGGVTANEVLGSQGSFGGSAANPSSLGSSVFGGPPAGQASVFGGTCVSQGSVFGGIPTSQTSVFGGIPASQTSVFGGAPANQGAIFPGSSVGQPPVFGEQKTNSGSVFGGTSETQKSVFDIPGNRNPQPGMQNVSLTVSLAEYTPMESLTAEEKEQFLAQTFTLGKIPLRPPPRELCM